MKEAVIQLISVANGCDVNETEVKKTNIQAFDNLHESAISYRKCPYYSQSLISFKISAELERVS